MQKGLEDTNIKLSSVATDITGKSGQAILRALLDGEQDPEKLADLLQHGRLAPQFHSACTPAPLT